MSRVKLPSLRALARENAARVAAALALATPAAAVAAEPADQIANLGTSAAPLQSKAALARISDPLVVVARAERRERHREAAAGPFLPVLGKVGYGDAQAAFGHARGRPHEGQDIFAPAGTPVVAPTDGIVVEGGSDGGRGNWVAIFDRRRERTYSYFHLVEPATVEAGARVEAGERIGKVGCTGSCSGDHLHFEVREGRGPYGTAVDPMPLLARWKPAEG